MLTAWHDLGYQNSQSVNKEYTMKKRILAVRPYRHSKSHKWILNLRPYGKGRMFFKTKAAADAECFRQRTLLERHSRDAVGLSQREMSDFITARKKLAEYGESINDAVAFRVDHLERVRRCKTTVAQLAAEVVAAKHKDGRSSAYITDLELRLDHFCRDFGSRPIAGITVEELDNWLRALPGSPKSRANYRANVGVMFSYAEARGLLDSNPILRTAKPKLPDNPPEIFTVDELRGLLEAAQRVEPDVLPMLAIGAFAGLRDAEIKRLHWEEIRLDRGLIEVTAAKSKSARRRFVPIQPNLMDWLRPYSGKTGAVVPEGWRGKIDRVCEAAGLTHWPMNGLRHSFASYRLAAIHDAPRVASELGHTSPQMLYSTYREVVMPEEAERYWKIAPAADAANVVTFEATVLS
jgi:integrase